MSAETANRRSKDSVFVDIFSDVNYVFELYKELHPEDTEATVDDINIQTIKSVLVNTLYNDLGFFVKDKFVILAEAQSVWNPNIALRMMFYLSETYRRYLADSEQSEHSTTRVTLPKPELYVIYSGENDVPEEISFADDFFEGASPIDIRVKILSREDDKTISGQYIGGEKGYLAPYLKNHEKEAVTMMSELFDEEYLRSQYNKAERNKNFAEGMEKGMEKGIEKGKSSTLKSVADKLREMGLSDEQIKKATSI